MAALSYFNNSNWDTFQQLDDYSDVTAIPDPELLPPLPYAVDPYNEVSYPQNFNYDSFVNGDAASLPLHHLNDPFFPHQELNPFFHCPKRQRVCDSDEQLIYSSFFNGFASNPCLPMLQDFPPPEIVMPPPPMTVFPAAEFSIGSSATTKYSEGVKKEASGESLSPQSVAARQRRRKITEKTQELGKLIPGGQKMNTAEMLQSAYKYIKFLQAQFALLEFVASNSHTQDNIEAPFEGEEELQILLESPLIQEKLYSTEYCLVPNKFVEEVGVVDELLKSNSYLEKDISVNEHACSAN